MNHNTVQTIPDYLVL